MDVIDILRQLVAIDSVNPSLVEGAAGEAAIAAWIAGYLRRAGFDVTETEVAPGRPNVIAVADGRSAGPVRMLCGHTDTVGVEGMDAPFDPIVRDGRVFGRGAQDMKGGVAAMIAAAERWLHGARRGAGRVIVAAVADEEYASLGADALAAAWTADAAVIPEPTGLALGVMHKGFSCVEAVTHGRAAHGSRPKEGRDAILDMGRLLARLEAHDTALQARPPHAVLGTASLHTGRIAGGTELSVYPARCTLQIERRTLPGEGSESALVEVAQMIRDLVAADPEFRAEVRLLLARDGYEISPASPLPGELRAAAASAHLNPAIEGLSYWTDAAILGAAGISTVLFGPDGAGLHTIEEHVTIDSVRACAGTLEAWLSLNSRSAGER